MKKQQMQQVGLIVEGNATTSPVLRLSSLSAELGPVKSVGLQVARRFSNMLRAGYAVTEYPELASASLILLRLPDSEVPRIVSELNEADLPFHSLSFVLCETWLTSDALNPLRRHGSHAATLTNVGPLSQNTFMVEGDLPAVRRVKRFLARGEARVVEIRPGTKSLYFAANILCAAIPIPAVQMAQHALRESGVSGNDLLLLTDEWLHQLHERVRKGARGAWGGPLAETAELTSSEHFRQLAVLNPELAESFDGWLSLARTHMAKRAKRQAATAR